MSDFSLRAPEPSTWTLDHTVDYLTDHPLPTDFRWNGRPVVPSHRSVTAYGKWLKETPYHRGLFPIIHRLMQQADVFPRRSALSVEDELVGWIAAVFEQKARQSELF